MKQLLCVLFINTIVGIVAPAAAQSVTVLTNGTKTSIRGLSVVTDKIVWVSGSNGMIGKSFDGGVSFSWQQVKGYERTDFRDIEAFDKKVAVIMGIDSPAYILRTVDGGENWTKVYENNQHGIFLDAMEFWNEQSGIVLGDPINNHFIIARTFDGGRTWKQLPEDKCPVADSGEACFASSGTNIRKLNKAEAIFISGGRAANVFIRDSKLKLPIVQGKETTGANSIAVKNKKAFIIVGGDFNTKDSSTRNCVITGNGGSSFTAPLTGPHGYRSCVEYLAKKRWITCGLNGVDITGDDGLHFDWISKESFHVVRKAKKGRAVYFAGGNGKIGKLVEIDRK